MLLAAPLQAPQLRNCDTFDANASNVDWQEPTRAYANGNVRLIKIDIEEPACCAVFLMVLYPVPDQPFLNCALIGRDDSFGWADLNLPSAMSDYDPQTGLAITLPVRAFDGDTFQEEQLRVTIDQALGSILVE